MKTFIFIIIISSMQFAQSDPNINWLHPSPQGQQLNWIKMWDANNWYLAGQYGMFMKTTDAGQTWTVNNKAGWPNNTYPGTLTNWHANAGWFFDPNNGIIVGSNANGVLRTTDGGETFDTLTILPGSQSGKNLYNIYFVNSNVGFICGSSAYKIFKTTDGGSTWNQLPNLPGDSYYDVYASDELNIIACGSSGNFFKTTDGGANWNIISLGTPNSLIDLEFINISTGYVAGQGGFFRYTTDGGLTWTGTNVPMNYISAKLIVNSGNVYYAGHPTELYKSTDNGASWTTITMTTPGTYTNLNYCADVFGSNIVVAGALGNIYKSTNDGNNWNNLLQISTSASFIRSIYVDNTSGKIIAAGRWTDVPGSIIISNDGGNTWEASPFIAGQLTAFNRMQMFDDNNGYFTGDGGFFAKTTDGGLDLTPITIPFANQNILQDLDFINQSTGWVVGGLPFPVLTSIVAKTTDGGVSWINQTPAGLQGVQLAVDFVNENVGYFGGSSLYKTTNGGDSWNTIAVPGVSNIRSIKAFDADNLYMISSDGSGTGGIFLKSTDGGTSWNPVTLPVGTDLFGQVWMDMNNGFLNGTLGLILLTHDGGGTWEIMNTGGWTTYGGYMVSPDIFYVTAGDGQIFRYTASSVPVELTSFSGSYTNNKITLNWITSTETNNRGFDIERKTQSSEWEKIGFVAGNGTTTKINSYNFIDNSIASDKYSYRLKQKNFDGTFNYSNVVDINANSISEFSLNQNYPNPFNPTTKITFTIPQTSNIKLTVFNALGEKVSTLINEVKNSGTYEINFNGSDLASGVYVYRIEAVSAGKQAGNFISSKKMILIK